ncbi:hypothetical protein [Nostoc sp. UHCC 0870]|uniref:hypothetical protein n=1 Tax=Nostoc sp. UHCC 0870 TaxID=2914041 RepID=UPI001EDE0145|nr:hypothetical protein [Nostoc sp. UHCC 0870]UKP01604.1 hypothetical protein L6494_30730 [Nostoc sp. UHCC 0870]
MQSPAAIIIALLVAICILVNAIASLLIPIAHHYYARYQHYKMIEARRDHFYSELRMLMKSA